MTRNLADHAPRHGLAGARGLDLGFDESVQPSQHDAVVVFQRRGSIEVLWALRRATDPAVLRVAAAATAFGSAIGLVVTLVGLNTASLNAMGWSSVVIYAFFLAAWGRLAMATHRPAASAA